MTEIKARRALAYGATGIFFLVAASAQLQGAALTDTFLKAGVACAVMILIGLVLLKIVSTAAQQSAAGGPTAEAVETPEPETPNAAPAAVES